MRTAKGLVGSRPRLGTWVQPETNWSLLDPDVLGWLLERKFSAPLLIEFTELRQAVEPGPAVLPARAAGTQGKTAPPQRNPRILTPQPRDAGPSLNPNHLYRRVAL